VSPVLDVAGLSVAYGPVKAVRDVSFSVGRGEALGLIGESGSGKSTIAYALMRHLRGGRITADRLALQGRDLLGLSPGALAATRGRTMAMVYQDPMSALNPVMRVGESRSTLPTGDPAFVACQLA
jgi:peptide/nickel transport system ATP-binding protein